MTQTTPAELLHDLARSLNELRDLGVEVDLRFDAVLTKHGYVFPGKDDRWMVGLRVDDLELSPQEDHNDD